VASIDETESGSVSLSCALHVIVRNYFLAINRARVWWLVGSSHQRTGDFPGKLWCNDVCL